MIDSNCLATNKFYYSSFFSQDYSLLFFVLFKFLSNYILSL
nr:MAG TPA: hypothetical protein [Caudoviricetes sp.]